MSAFEIFVAIYVGLLVRIFGAVFTARMRRIEADEAGLRSEPRSEVAELRFEIAALRSDITRVALAAGARPRASEG